MKLQNVALRTGAQRWEPVWNDLEAAPGGPLPGWIRGLAFDRISGLEIDGLHVAGFPGDGLATGVNGRNAVALDVRPGCSVNGDFERVGRSVDQRRVRA